MDEIFPVAFGLRLVNVVWWRSQIVASYWAMSHKPFCMFRTHIFILHHVGICISYAIFAICQSSFTFCAFRCVLFYSEEHCYAFTLKIVLLHFLVWLGQLEWEHAPLVQAKNKQWHFEQSDKCMRARENIKILVFFSFSPPLSPVGYVRR